MSRVYPREQTAPPEYEHAQWARNMKAALAAGQSLSPNDVAWLYSTTGDTPYLSSAEAMCDALINKWALYQITERLKT